MPNTLAHMGAQALITRGMIARADLGWIWLGVLLPDLPWIAQRAIKLLPVSIDPIDLRLYAVVQSTLLFCLGAAAGVALLSARPGRVFSILALGSVLHLLLDATQTKWANGVLLFAPVDWHIVNFGLYWPETWPSYALSLLGLFYVAWAFAGSRPGGGTRPHLAASRKAAACAIFGLYALGPLTLMPQAQAADVHFAGTLGAVAERQGKAIEFDRARIEHLSDGSPVLAVWTGETLAVTGVAIPPDALLASVKGRFVDATTVEVTALYTHAPGRRDLITWVGLGLILVWWLWTLTARRRKSGV